jgi:hypothetical protein
MSACSLSHQDIAQWSGIDFTGLLLSQLRVSPNVFNAVADSLGEGTKDVV